MDPQLVVRLFQIIFLDKLARIYNFKNKKKFIIVKKQSIIGLKISPEVGIEHGIIGFKEVKYKCPRLDPHVGRFFYRTVRAFPGLKQKYYVPWYVVP